jgi:hypothetical protein
MKEGFRPVPVLVTTNSRTRMPLCVGRTISDTLVHIARAHGKSRLFEFDGNAIAGMCGFGAPGSLEGAKAETPGTLRLGSQFLLINSFRKEHTEPPKRPTRNSS